MEPHTVWLILKRWCLRLAYLAFFLWFLAHLSLMGQTAGGHTPITYTYARYISTVNMGNITRYLRRRRRLVGNVNAVRALAHPSPARRGLHAARARDARDRSL